LKGKRLWNKAGKGRKNISKAEEKSGKGIQKDITKSNRKPFVI